MPAEARATPSRSVLIVDDDRSALEAMEAALAREFRVSSATDAPSAQKILDRGPSDLPPAAQATAGPIEDVPRHGTRSCFMPAERPRAGVRGDTYATSDLVRPGAFAVTATRIQIHGGHRPIPGPICTAERR